MRPPANHTRHQSEQGPRLQVLTLGLLIALGAAGRQGLPQDLKLSWS